MLGAIVFSIMAAGGALAAASGARAGEERDGKRKTKGTRKIAVREAGKVDKLRKLLKQKERDAAKLKRKLQRMKRTKGRSAPKPSKPGDKDKPSKGKPGAKDKPSKGAGFKVNVTDPKKQPKPDSDKPDDDEKKLGPKGAAAKLYRYTARKIRRGESHELGTKGKPNRTVKRLQARMGKIKSDGQYGPKTRRRGKELIGKDFPIRKRVKPSDRKRKAPAPPKPDAEDVDTQPDPDDEPTGQRAPVQAAEDLLEYAKSIGTDGRAIAFGYKNRPNETVQEAQSDMGELVADGIYGNKTRARGKALTGKLFPPR